MVNDGFSPVEMRRGGYVDQCEMANLQEGRRTKGNNVQTKTRSCKGRNGFVRGGKIHSKNVLDHHEQGHSGRSQEHRDSVTSNSALGFYNNLRDVGVQGSGEDREVCGYEVRRCEDPYFQTRTHTGRNTRRCDQDCEEGRNVSGRGGPWNNYGLRLPGTHTEDDKCGFRRSDVPSSVQSQVESHRLLDIRNAAPRICFEDITDSNGKIKIGDNTINESTTSCEGTSETNSEISRQQSTSETESSGLNRIMFQSNQVCNINDTLVPRITTSKNEIVGVPVSFCNKEFSYIYTKDFKLTHRVRQALVLQDVPLGGVALSEGSEDNPWRMYHCVLVRGQNNVKQGEILTCVNALALRACTHGFDSITITKYNSVFGMYWKKFLEMFVAALSRTNIKRLNVMLPNECGNFFKYCQQDLFTVPAGYSLAHCVSQDMYMGKGIAVEFKERYGMVKELIAQGKIVGETAAHNIDGGVAYYLITKSKFNDKPSMDSLEMSLNDLREQLVKDGVTKLAMPKIGCGLDGLDWGQVSTIVHKTLSDVLTEVVVCVVESKEMVRSSPMISVPVRISQPTDSVSIASGSSSTVETDKAKAKAVVDGFEPKYDFTPLYTDYMTKISELTAEKVAECNALTIKNVKSIKSGALVLCKSCYQNKGLICDCLVKAASLAKIELEEFNAQYEEPAPVSIKRKVKWYNKMFLSKEDSKYDIDQTINYQIGRLAVHKKETTPFSDSKLVNLIDRSTRADLGHERVMLPDDLIIQPLFAYLLKAKDTSYPTREISISKNLKLMNKWCETKVCSEYLEKARIEEGTSEYIKFIKQCKVTVSKVVDEKDSDFLLAENNPKINRSRGFLAAWLAKLSTTSKAPSAPSTTSTTVVEGLTNPSGDLANTEHGQRALVQGAKHVTHTTRLVPTRRDYDVVSILNM